jgi:hypothetical protein
MKDTNPQSHPKIFFKIKSEIFFCIATFIKMYKRMKIIETKNLYPKIGIVNGTIGYVQNNSIKKNGFIMMN